MPKNETNYLRLGLILSFGVVFKLLMFWLMRHWLRKASEVQ